MRKIIFLLLLFISVYGNAQTVLHGRTYTGTTHFNSSHSGSDTSRQQVVDSLKITTISSGLLKISSNKVTQAVAGTDYQTALTNPVTGTGTSGQVAYFNGISTITGSSNHTFDGRNQTIGGYVVSDTMYGSTSSGGNLRLESTSNATKGFIQFGASSAYDGTNIRLGIGTSSPAAIIHMAGNISASSWTTNGIGIRQAAATYTNTTSSGTVAAQYINVLSQPTVAASSSTTFTLSGNLFVDKPIAGANVTQTNSASIVSSGPMLLFGAGSGSQIGTYDATTFSLVTSNTNRLFITSNGRLSVGPSSSASSVIGITHSTINNNAWTTTGIGIVQNSCTFNDQSSSGTVANAYTNNYGAQTIGATNSTTFTNYYANNWESASSGPNVTITNPWAGRFNGNLKVESNIVSAQYRLSALNTAPSSASDTGTTGEIRIDANYIYICTATNTWKRVAIATW